jgi:DNA-binding response OmpR family regulator
MRIALLEDDPDQAALVRLWLEEAGHLLTTLADGKAFLKHITRESYDLFLLDWNTPQLSGDQVLDWVRANITAPIPVMFMTARTDEADIVTALEKGADDYLTKPVRKFELLARVNALERRSRQEYQQKEILEVDQIRIDVAQRRVRCGEREIEMTQKEFDLTLFLFRHIGQLLSRGHILESIWGRNPDLNTRTVDTHVSRIRNKLGLSPESGLRLSSVYFYGYRLERVTPAA